jgi:hypothetical protein
MNAYKGSGGIAPIILNLLASQLQASVLLPQERKPIPTGIETGWAADTVCTFWGRENVLLPPGFKPRIVQPLAQSLYQLRHSNSSLAMTVTSIGLYVEWNLLITEPQWGWNSSTLVCRFRFVQVLRFWILEIVKVFRLNTDFCYAQISFKAGFNSGLVCRGLQC